MHSIHSPQLCAPSDVALRELEWGGVRWERLVSLSSLPMADSWVVWTYVNTAPPPFSVLLPAVLKSPVASLLPDVASRCGLERVRRIRDAEAATKLLAFPPPSSSNE